MRGRVLLEVRTHIKLGSKILEQGLGGCARPVRPAVSDHYRCSDPVTRTVSRMFYVSSGTAGLDQDINTTHWASLGGITPCLLWWWWVLSCEQSY